MKKSLFISGLLFLIAIVFGTNLNAQTYCVPIGTNSARYIDNFSTTGGVQNITNNSSGFSVNGHGVFLTEVLAQVKSETVNFNVDIEGGTAGFRVWVDWDQDGVFDVISELVYNSTSYSESHSGSFIIPMTATEGSTRMRIVSHYLSSTGSVDPCLTTFSDGEFEDYTIDILPAPSCIAPTALANVARTSTTGDITWTAGGSESNWNISWGTPGYTPGDGNEVSTGVATANSFEITGLSIETPYEVYVQADCGSGDESAWSGPLAFNTLCNAFNTPYFEGFETGFTHNADVENCLVEESENGSNYWRANDDYTTYNRSPRTGDWNVFLIYSNTDWIIIPINLIGGTSYTTEVYARQDGSTAANANITIGYGTIANSAGMTNVIAPATGIVNGDYQLITGEFTPAASGVYYIGIKGFINSSPWHISMDDISVYETPTCPAPTDLTATNMTSTSYDLGWTETGADTDWEIEYGPVGFAHGSGTTLAATVNPFTLTGFTPEVDYEFYVRSDCGAGDLSYWSGPLKFAIDYCEVSTTGGDYLKVITSDGAETDISYSATSQPAGSYANETAQIFEAYETQVFDINTEYVGGVQGVNIWVDWNNDYDFDASELVATIAGSGATKTLSVTVPAGTPEGEYRMRVRGLYGATANPPACGSASYGSTVDFTLTIVASPTCLPPIVLSTTNISSTSADLGWTENGSATTWNIQYGAPGFAIGSGTIVSGVSNPHTITITPETAYEFYVQADCGGSDESTWAGPFAFDNIYCEFTISTTSSTPRYIKSFATNGAMVDISNLNSGAGTPNPGYTDFTAITLEAFETQTFDFTISVDGTGTHGASVFVDWNNDFVFDASEKVYTSGGYQNFPLTGTITVPANTPVGQYRMRVVADLSTANPNACSGTNGEAEDYTLEVVAAPSCLPPSALSSTNMTSTSADLGWTEDGTATTWNIQYGAPGFAIGSGTSENGVSNPHTITITPETAYEFYVQADCGGGDESIWAGPFAFDNIYCEFTISTTSSTPRYIKSFATTGAMVDISNLNSGAGTPNPGYTDFTTVTLETYETQTFDFTISVDGTGTHGASVFVDWNNNFVFDASEKVYTSGGYQSFPLTGTITVPANTPVGQYRMRVVADFSTANPGACSGTNGEAEDYTLEVVATPSCLPPSALIATNFTSTSADLGWTENSSATTWNIEYGPAGYLFGSGTTETGVTTNPFTLTGLSASTDYDFYVQSDCGSGDLSSWSNVSSFTTECAIYTAPFYEGFNNAVQPDCWDNLSSNPSSSADNFWRFNKQGEYGALNNGKTIGTFVSSDGSSPTPDSMMLITPKIDLSTLTNPELSFEWFSNNTNNPGDNVPLIVEIHDGTAWHYIDTLKGDNPSWLEAYYDLSAYAGNTVQIRFMTNQATIGTSAYYNDILLDEVRIDELTTCFKSFDLIISNVSTTAADIAWTAGGAETSWNISWGTAGYTPGGANEVGTAIASLSPYEITGLTDNTQYDVYVQSDCGGGDLSQWSVYTSFTTECGAANVPYVQDFESATTPYIPSCTSIENVGTGNDWKTTSTTSYGFSSKVLRYTYHSSNAADAWFYTQGINLTAGTEYQISYEYGAASFEEKLKVAYGTSSSSTGMTTTLADHTPATSLLYSNTVVFTPGVTDVYYFGFNAHSDANKFYLHVDNIVVDLVPPCVDPSTLSAANITGTSADLGWTENGAANTWNIEYGEAGFTQGGGTEVTGVATNPYNLTGLDVNTDYEFYVQSDCGVNESVWIGPFAFTTPCVESTGTDVQEECDSYTWIDGNTYTASNSSATYTLVGEAANGCDSIVTLNLTINNSVTGIDTQVACGSFTWIDNVEYTSSNTTAIFTLVGEADNGCDSIVTLNLTIDEPGSAGTDNAATVCLNEPFDLADLLSSGADAGGTWMSPTNTALASSVVTASGVGGILTYTYVVSSGVCPDVTAEMTITVDPGCDYLSTSKEMLIDVSVYPNPATTQLNIVNPSNTSSLRVEMLDMNGRVVLIENKALNNATGATIAIDHLERGIYTLRIYNDEVQRTFKVVKQ